MPHKSIFFPGLHKTNDLQCEFLHALLTFRRKHYNVAHSQWPAGRWRRHPVLPAALQIHCLGSQSWLPDLSSTTGLQTNLRNRKHICVFCNSHLLRVLLVSFLFLFFFLKCETRYSQKDGSVMTRRTPCVNFGWSNKQVTFCPWYSTAGRSTELVWVCEFVLASICISSSVSRSKEITVAGLPPDEMQETTQKSLPPRCTISFVMVTFGRAAKQEERQEEIVFPEASCVFFSNKLKSQTVNWGLGCFGYIGSRSRMSWMVAKHKPVRGFCTGFFWIVLTWAYHLSHLLAELPLRADVWPSCCPTKAERIALFNSGNQQRSESIIRQIKVVVPHKMSRRNKLTPHYSRVPGMALKEQCTLALRGFNHCHYKIIACLMLIGLPCSRQVEIQGIKSGKH